MEKTINPMEKILVNLLADLSMRDEQVVRLRFVEGMTQKQVGELYNMTNERVRQLEDRALKKINKTIKELFEQKNKK